MRTNCLLVYGSSFKGFSIVFPAPWLGKVESSQKSNGMWFFRHFLAPNFFHCNRNNRRDKLRSKFWREKMFRKPHLKLLRWFSVHGTNDVWNLTSTVTEFSPCCSHLWAFTFIFLQYSRFSWHNLQNELLSIGRGETPEHKCRKQA